MPFWLLGLLLVLLGGCSSPSAPAADAPIRIRWERDPESLDPLALPNQQAIDAANLLAPSLLQVDIQSGQYAPALAVRLPAVRRLGTAQLALDYELRPEATWDDSQPVLATDVAFTLKLLQCPGLFHEGLQAQTAFIEECRPDPANPRRFTLICRGQAPEYRLASGDFPLLAEHLLDSAHTLRSLTLAQLRATPALPAATAMAARFRRLDGAHHPERLRGCGPYRLVNWQPNRSLLFRRKAAWWGSQVRPIPFVLLARPAQLQYLIVPDAAAAALALQRHELDVFPQVPSRVFQRLRNSATSRELTFATALSYDVVMVGFNTQHPALRDKYTRQALGQLLDPATLLAATQQGQGVRTASLVPPASSLYNDSLPLPAYNPARAAALLRQAGWQRGSTGWRRTGLAAPLHLVLRYRADDNLFATVGLQLQAAAAKLGIGVELRPTESSVLTQALHAGDFDAYVRTVKGNPFVFDFTPLLHSQAVGAGNFTGFSQPATDRLLAAVAATGEPVRKRQLLRRLQAQLADESPLIPLFFLPNRLVADRHVQHLALSGLKPGYAAAALSRDAVPQ